MLQLKKQFFVCCLLCCAIKVSAAQFENLGELVKSTIFVA